MEGGASAAAHSEGDEQRRRRSRSPSPPRQRKKRVSRFSDAPAATSAMPLHPTAALIAAVAKNGDSGGPGAVGSVLNMLQMGLPMPVPGQPAPDTQAHKTMHELFVGNLPSNLPQMGGGAKLVEFLNMAMLETRLNTQPGSPIVDCRLSAKFAFIVLRSPDETTNALNMTGIPFSGHILKIERPGTFVGPKSGTQTWAQLVSQLKPGTSGGSLALTANTTTTATATAALIPAAGPLPAVMEQHDPSTKAARELFVGNTPEGTTGDQLREFMGKVMEQVDLVTGPGNPIINVRVNAKFSFIECRSIDEATNALNMDGIPFNGNDLRVRRPDKYAGTVTPSLCWGDFLAAREKMEKAKSNVIRLGNVVEAAELEDDIKHQAAVDDIACVCGRYGKILSVTVPRPGQDQGAAGACAFVKFAEKEAAERAVGELIERTYDGSAIEAVYFDPARLESGIYTIEAA